MTSIIDAAKSLIDSQTTTTVVVPTTKPTTKPTTSTKPAAKVVAKPTTTSTAKSAKPMTMAEMAARLAALETENTRLKTAKSGDKAALGLPVISSSLLARVEGNGTKGSIQCLVETAEQMLRVDKGATDRVTFAAFVITTLVETYYESNHFALAKEDAKRAKVYDAVASFNATAKRLKLTPAKYSTAK